MKLDLSEQQKHMICFTGTRAKETLYIGDNTYTMHLAGVISSIAELTQEYFLQINHICEFLESINDISSLLSQLSQLPEMISRIEAPHFLKDIILWQPLLLSRYTDAVEEDKYSLDYNEIKEMLHSSNPRQQTQEKLASLREHNAIKWNCLEMLLKGTETSYTGKEGEVLLQCFYTFRFHFRNMVGDIYWINNYLFEYLDASQEQKEKIIKKIYSIGHQISIVNRQNPGVLYKKHSIEMYSQVYAVPGVYELITLELELIFSLGYELKNCAFCGRYFVARKMDSVYCKNPNPLYNNKTCSEIGPNWGYREKRKKDPIKKAFDTFDMRYRAWKYDHLKDKGKGVQDDILDRYEKWRADAKEIINAYDNGEISYEDAVKMMEPPKSKDRSPVLVKFLYDKRQAEDIQRNEELRGKRKRKGRNSL